MTKVFIASDHAGFDLKTFLIKNVAEKTKIEFVDLGPDTDASVDYPEFAARVAEKVGKGEGLGVLVCGSGIGMAITANKLNGVRAANVWDATSARLSREHNNANIVCLGSRLVGREVALDAVVEWLKATFQGGRHQKRIDLITSMEKKK